MPPDFQSGNFVPPPRRADKPLDEPLEIKTVLNQPLWYSSLIAGVIRGSMEVLGLKVAC